MKRQSIRRQTAVTVACGVLNRGLGFLLRLAVTPLLLLLSPLIGAGAALLFTWLWTADPALHIYGAGFASMLGHALTLLCSGISFIPR